jgi:hypothetical protein
MPLTPHERKVLDALDRDLREDPRLADELTREKSSAPVRHATTALSYVLLLTLLLTALAALHALGDPRVTETALSTPRARDLVGVGRGPRGRADRRDHDAALPHPPQIPNQAADVMTGSGQARIRAPVHGLERLMGSAVNGSDADNRAAGRELPMIRLVPQADREGAGHGAHPRGHGRAQDTAATDGTASARGS